MSIFKHTSKFLKPFKNIFILILIVFIVWMLFFDANSYLIHHELNSDINDLEAEKEYYQKEILKVLNLISQIEDLIDDDNDLKRVIGSLKAILKRKL